MLKKDISAILLAVIFCILVIYIVIFPNESFKAAQDGLLLWFNVVLPSLLPFFICVEILIGLGVVRLLGSCFQAIMRPIFNIPGEGAFAFFMSIASGYPVGAKITASLLENNQCSSKEAQRMLSLCSTSGPLFIIGAVATGILSSPKLGLLLALSHYLSAISSGLLMSFWGGKRGMHKTAATILSNRAAISPLKKMLEYREKDGRPFGMLMGDAVKNGMNLNLMIGGFIILFSVITSVLKTSGILLLLSKSICLLLPFLNLDPQAVSSLFIGLLEVTNGIKECALVDMPLISKLMLVSFMIGFGGLSINAQVLSVISGVKLKFGIYSLMKIFQGIAASIFTYFLFGIVGAAQAFNPFDAMNVSLYIRYLNTNFITRIGDSIINLSLVLAIMLLFALCKNMKRAKV
ncbi:MAG: Sporulation integral rane protein YlbJ [Clostridia bacterium]|nr:Sporulation integral rane protein YlbJ [Clostridia bacterium]